MFKTRPRVGVALGGGAARGLAHVGVLQALEEEGIAIQALAGVSVGAMIAAGYAGGLSAAELAEIARQVSWRQLGRWSLRGPGLHSTDRMERFLEAHFPVRRFEDLKIPLRILATDLHTGKAVVIEQGDLFEAVRASCAIPGFYVPVRRGKHLLADGFLSCNLPVAEVRDMGAQIVVASSIGLEVPEGTKFSTTYQVLMRSLAILSSAAQQESQQQADLLVRPQVERFAWHDLSAAPQLIEAGYQATRQHLPRLRRLLCPGLWCRLQDWLRSSPPVKPVLDTNAME